MHLLMFQIFNDFFTESRLMMFLIRFVLHIISLIILVRVLYYEFRNEGVPEFLFAFFLLGIIVFLICTALEMVQVELGFALGLFALFGILRFRTQSIPVREMTYLFLVIGIGMVNSLVEFLNPIEGIIVLNSLIIIPAWLLEVFLCKNNVKQKEIIYDKIEDLALTEKELLEKISNLTGFRIKKINILKIDYTRNVIIMDVFYIPNK